MKNNNSLANRKKTKHTVFETDIEGWSIRFGGRGGGGLQALRMYFFRVNSLCKIVFLMHDVCRNFFNTTLELFLCIRSPLYY